MDGRPMQFEPIRSRAAEPGFCDALRRLKLDVLGTDDSPIPITGYYTPRQRRGSASVFRLPPESVQPSTGGSRNDCPVPGTLLNTNNLRGFQNLDPEHLLKAEAKKILDDIMSGKVEEDPSLLLRFLVASFVDLKNWKVYYNIAFPALVFNSKLSLLSLSRASQVLSQEEAASLSKSCNEWRNSRETTVVPFFLVNISSDSSATIRQFKDWEACQANGQKMLFGFYDHGSGNCPGWALRNYIAFLSLRWKIEKIQFFCYREVQGRPDLEQSLIGEVMVPASHGCDCPDYVPEAVGWEEEKRGTPEAKQKKPKEWVIDFESMSPIKRDEEEQLMHLKLMGWRHFPVNLDKLSRVRCLILGAGSLGCEVARLLMTWGIRKLTVVDNGCVAMSDLVKQSLYIDKDYGIPKATAIVPHLKERCPAVEVEGIQMEIPMLGHPVSPKEIARVLDDCKRLQTLVASNDAVFLLTDTWESRWLPTLLCANENKIAVTAVLGYDSYLVMRHGAGPSTITDSMEAVSAGMEKLSTEDALRCQRLGCCFCSDAAALVNSALDQTLDQQCTIALPGLATIASGKAAELYARMLHHPDEIHAPGDIAGMSSEHPLGLLPHQIQESLLQCALSTPLSYSSSNCTACSNAVLSEYRRRGMDFVLQVINKPTYLEDLTGLSRSVKSEACSKLPSKFQANLEILSSVRCLLLGAGTLGCDVARLLMDWGIRKLTVVDIGDVVASNLARQSLYTSDDRNKPKATAMLKHLKERCPSVDAAGLKMEIPMPGHPVSPGNAASVLEHCKRLQELVSSHDAVFLLTDTRESRWLPTLLCANENKIAITAALGFDSYLVMRHGAGPRGRSEGADAAVAGMDNLTAEDALGRQRLGCYFCNDVVAPVDSVSNRTLDQQCTATRPGLASIASGRAADLFARMLHHPDGIHAPGEIAGTSSDDRVGLLPHQIRGSLSRCDLLTLLGYSSRNCTACSNAVLSEYRRRGMDFVMQVINEPTYLEDLTGLTDLMKSAAYSQVEWVDDGTDDDFVEI